MRGVILAGGLATRLYPLTYATNKHLLPVYDKPMIFYPIETLVKAGIDEILIIVSGPHSGHFINVLKNGKDLGVGHLEYAYQENPKGGIADALALAEDFAYGTDIAVILGDNTTDADITKDIDSFKQGAKVFLKKVSDPQRFGVPEFEGEKIVKIIEKPTTPPSDFAVTGLYLYDESVFDKIRQVKPSDRGELEITAVNNLYLDENNLDWCELEGFWSDAGTFDSLFKSNQHWYQKGNS
jgi:glucose-1-phosphate thymidylyltransferase